MNSPKILYAIILFCALTSCFRKVKVQCKPGRNYLVEFYTPNISDTIPDRLASFTPYQKGSNFSVQADSTFENKLTISSSQKAVFMSTADCSRYDWKMVLHPSGRQYLVKNIAFYERKEKQVPDDTQTPCYDEYSYEINDTVSRSNPGYLNYIEIRLNY